MLLFLKSVLNSNGSCSAMSLIESYFLSFITGLCDNDFFSLLIFLTVNKIYCNGKENDLIIQV